MSNDTETPTIEISWANSLRLRELYNRGDRTRSEDRELETLLVAFGCDRMDLNGNDSWDVYAGYKEGCEDAEVYDTISYEDWLAEPAPWSPNYGATDDED